jgi:hypothetical protein
MYTTIVQTMQTQTSFEDFMKIFPNPKLLKLWEEDKKSCGTDYVVKIFLHKDFKINNNSVSELFLEDDEVFNKLIHKGHFLTKLLLNHFQNSENDSVECRIKFIKNLLIKLNSVSNWANVITLLINFANKNTGEIFFEMCRDELENISCDYTLYILNFLLQTPKQSKKMLEENKLLEIDDLENILKYSFQKKLNNDEGDRPLYAYC